MLNQDFIVSGSYDHTVKASVDIALYGAIIDCAQVWNRKTGALVADLSGGHTGRIFCVGFDCTKVRLLLPILFLS